MRHMAWAEVTAPVDVVGDHGHVVASLQPGVRYDVTAVGPLQVTIVGPGGQSGYVPRAAVQLHGDIPPGAFAPASPVPGSHVAAGRRLPLGIAGFLMVGLWVYDQSVNPDLPTYWLVVPVSGVVALIAAATGRPVGGYVSVVAFGAAGLAAIGNAAEVLTFYDDAGLPVVESFLEDFAFVFPVPFVFVLALAGMAAGALLGRAGHRRAGQV